MLNRHISVENFLNAARTNDLTQIQQYIAENRSNPSAINVTDRYGNTALIIAAANGHVAIVRALLAVTDINLDAQNNNYSTADQVAKRKIDIHTAYVQIYNLIIDAIRTRRTPSIAAAAAIDTAPATTVTSSLSNAHQAARTGNLSVEDFLNAARTNDLTKIQQYIRDNRSNPAAINVTNQDGNTALIIAAANGHDVAVQTLLAARANVNAAGLHGYTALIKATTNGHTTVVRILLAAPGINVNAANHYGDTALIRATVNGDTAAMQALLAAPGINVNAANHDGDTALTLAAAIGDTAAVQTLIAAGANVNAANLRGDTALIRATANGHTAIVQALMTAIRARNASGMAAAAAIDTAPATTVTSSLSNAHQAARTGNLSVENFLNAARSGDLTKIQQYIAENRSNPTAVNVTDRYGYTALILAAAKGHVAIVRALLAVTGINVNAASQFGNTALIWAAQYGHTAVVQALIAAGANVNTVNQYGETALIRAVATNDHVAIVQALMTAICARNASGMAAAAAIDTASSTTATSSLSNAHQAARNKMRQEQERSAASAAAASSTNTVIESNSNDTARLDTENPREARLRFFDARSLPATASSSSLASTADDSDSISIGRTSP